VPEPHADLVDRALAARVALWREQKGKTQAELATCMTARGMGEWRGHTVAMVEAGRRRLRIAELAELAECLDVAFDDFIWKDLDPEASDENDALTRWYVVVFRDAINRAYIEDEAERFLGSREPRGVMVGGLWYETLEEAMTELAQQAEGERLNSFLARRLEVTVDDLVNSAWVLWNRTPFDERRVRESARDAEGAPQQVRGHVTRQMIAELTELIRGDTDA
jgi:transcriptional regulator with XRE-family HTH domain